MSGDGITLEVEFTIPGEETLVIQIPAPAWPIIAPYFEEASAEATRRRAAPDGAADTEGDGAEN